MNAKLKALLTFVAILGAGAGVMVFTTQSGTTIVMLVDAGVRTDCNRRQARCTFFKPGADGSGYTERTFVLAQCPNADGGKAEFIIPPKLAGRVFNLDACRLVATANNFDPNEDPTEVAGSCACVRADAGNCRYADAGRNLGRNEMAPDDWVGSDCVPRPCGELFGFPSRPEECAP
jgi:hypothetical protein